MLVELKLLKRQDLVSVIANAIKTGGQKDQVSIYHIYRLLFETKIILFCFPIYYTFIKVPIFLFIM